VPVEIGLMGCSIAQCLFSGNNDIGHAQSYSQTVDKHFETITSGRALPSDTARQLMESGFVIIPGPIPAQRIPDLAAAYDKVMSSGSGPDFKMASTTTRMH